MSTIPGHPMRPPRTEPAPPRGLLGYWFVTLRQTRLVRVMLAEGEYVGGTFIIGGTILLVALYWRQLSATGLLTALTAILAGLGLAIGGGPAHLARLRAPDSEPRRRVTGVFLALASVAAAGAAGSVVEHRVLFAGTAVGLGVAVVAYLAVPTGFGLLTAVSLACVWAVSTVASFGRATPLSVGGALLLVAAALGLAAGTGLILHQRLGLGLAGCVALVGAQQPLAWAESFRWAYGLSLAVGLVSLALFTIWRVTTLVVVGVIAVAVAVLEATWDLTSGPTRIAVTLIATGFALIVTSAYGISFWQRKVT